MAKFKITAPVEGFRGDVAGLIFRDGSAVADDTTDRAALAYCRRRGYTVEPVDTGSLEAEGNQDDEADTDDEGADVPVRPRSGDPKAEWVTYAIARGADRDDAENATKAELVELYGS